jgi:hypothetical protein
MEIKEEKRWIVGDGKECKSKEEAELYIKTIKSEQELTKALKSMDCTSNEIENYITIFQSAPYEITQYIENYMKFRKAADKLK